ncbi:MAG: hypothetical protein KA120_04445 [Candidatus Goldbacteria bacterium]|nr:hypothetical protein [Candidatus Goldiibacteriota bacterium]
MKKLVKYACVFVLMFSGCNFLWQHNPEKARDMAESFLNAIYVENNFNKAYQMCDEKMKKIFGIDFLENTSKKFKTKYVALERLVPDSYFYEQGDRSITIFFSGLSEKGISYHKVILEYDEKGEYKIISTFFLEKPFDGYRNLKKFRTDSIPVR